MNYTDKLLFDGLFEALIEETFIEREDFEINGTSPVSDELLLDTPLKDISTNYSDHGYMGNEDPKELFEQFFWASEFIDDNSQVEEAAKSLDFKLTGNTEHGDFIENAWLVKLLKSGITLRELITLMIDEVNALSGSPKSESSSRESSSATENSGLSAFQKASFIQRQQQLNETSEMNENMDNFFGG